MWISLALVHLTGFVTLIYANDFTVECGRSVEAEEGKHATLSCKVKPSVNLTDEFAQWSLKGEADKNVLVWRKGEVQPNDQHEQFKDRTVIDEKDLENGHIVITISKLIKEDQGNYACLVTIGAGEEERKGKGHTKLLVTTEGERDESKGPTSTAAPGSPATGPELEQLKKVHSIVVAILTLIVMMMIVLTAVSWRQIGKLFQRVRGRFSSHGDKESKDKIGTTLLVYAWNRQAADNPHNIPLQDLGPPAPQNDDINGEREPLQQDNAGNGQAQEDGN